MHIFKPRMRFTTRSAAKFQNWIGVRFERGLLAYRPSAAREFARGYRVMLNIKMPFPAFWGPGNRFL